MRPTRRNSAARPPSRVVQGESSQARQMAETRLRVTLVATFFGLCFFMLSARLLEVSTMGGGDLPFKRLVTEPQLLLESDDDVDASKVAQDEQVQRHEIIDRNGYVLATSIETASLVANPTLIRHEPELAAQLHAIFPDESTQSLNEKLMKKRSTFLYLRRHLSPKQQEAVNNLGIPGLFFEPDTRRVYPYGGLFSHVIGYVGVDNQGLAGIEKSFDMRLLDPSKNEPLQLSLDLRVQSMMHDELAKTVAEFNAIGATGIVLDMRNGEVVAMSNLPEFDPHQPGRATPLQLFNRATLGVYEMGSTFKTFTLAAALQNGVTTMQGGADAAHPIHSGGFTIHDHDPMGRWLSVPEIFAYSSNIGTAKLALQLGSKRQQDFLRKLGMFEPAKLEVPEIARPIVPREWTDLTTMTVGYGHGLSVSPMQLINGIATVSGDGELHPMTLLKDGTAGRFEGPMVMSKKTVPDVRDLLRLVVRYGTGRSANAAGYEVGGKTGTAEKNVNGVYNPHAKVALFASVFPIYAPRYAMLVMVDEPKGNKSTYGFATGGWISAPVVGRMVQRMAPLLGIAPDFNNHDGRVEAIWAQAKSRDTKKSIATTDEDSGGVHATSF
ncbi:MAG: peptidoglycan D,D-transpeptidase FtsI family protein [Rickettsiales bacterium]